MKKLIRVTDTDGDVLEFSEDYDGAVWPAGSVQPHPSYDISTYPSPVMRQAHEWKVGDMVQCLYRTCLNQKAKSKPEYHLIPVRFKIVSIEIVHVAQKGEA